MIVNCGLPCQCFLGFPKSSDNFLLTDLGAWKTPKIQNLPGNSVLWSAWRPSTRRSHPSGALGARQERSVTVNENYFPPFCAHFALPVHSRQIIFRRSGVRCRLVQSTRRIAPWIAPKSAAAPPQRPLDTDTPSRSSATQTATASPPSPASRINRNRTVLIVHVAQLFGNAKCFVAANTVYANSAT
jgi:hypothetical protein